MIPEWVEKQKRPNTTVKKIGNNYYLYYVTSSRSPEKKYPVCEQTYIGKITEEGVIRDKVSINISKTKASTLGDIIPNLDGRLGKVIALYVKKEWVCTQTEGEVMRELEERGICHDGKVILPNI
ncbi:MAG: hypothetical protein Q4A32_05795 [Lachnospiraceae bacterium]|nr:hypothetical protein [Lachnospiraceae bacterium]